MIAQPLLERRWCGLGRLLRPVDARRQLRRTITTAAAAHRLLLRLLAGRTIVCGSNWLSAGTPGF